MSDDLFHQLESDDHPDVPLAIGEDGELLTPIPMVDMPEKPKRGYRRALLRQYWYYPTIAVLVGVIGVALWSAAQHITIQTPPPLLQLPSPIPPTAIPQATQQSSNARCYVWKSTNNWDSKSCSSITEMFTGIQVPPICDIIPGFIALIVIYLVIVFNVRRIMDGY